MHRLLIPLAVVIASVAVYLPTASYDFVWDDARQIAMMESRFSWEQIPSYFTTDMWSYVNREKTNYYRPLFVLWLMLNDQAFGLDHAAWHATTILAHALAALLLYFLALRLIRNEIAAGVAALLFAVYPTHIEGVAWVSGVTEPLWAIFFFGALTLFIAGREETRQARRRMLRIGAAALFGVAIFAKETAIVLPALVFAYAWLFPEPAEENRPGRVGRAFTATLPYLQVAVLYLAMRMIALGGFAPRVNYWSPKRLIATLPGLVWLYTRELIWPLHLSVFPPVAQVRHLDWGSFFGPLIGSALVLAALLWIARQSRLAAFCALLIVIPMLPVFDLHVFAPEDFAHDRYLYVPSAGWCLLLALGLRQFASVARVPAIAVTATLAAALALLTVRESGAWRNDLSLAEQGVAVSPGNPAAQRLMGSALILSDRYAEAAPWVEQALSSQPANPGMNSMLGICHLKLRMWSQAASDFRLALAGMPDNPQSYLCLGMAELEMGQIADAEGDMRKAVRLRPRTSVQYRGYRTYLADLLERKGDLQGALAEYNRELEEYPDEADVLDRETALRKKMTGN